MLLVIRSTYTRNIPINIRLHCNEHWCMLMSEFLRAVFAILSCERKCNLVVNLQRKPFNYCSHGKVVCNSIVMDCHPLSGSLAYENVKDFKVIWRTFEHIHAAKLHITFFNQFWIFLQYFFDNNKIDLSIWSELRSSCYIVIWNQF